MTVKNKLLLNREVISDRIYTEHQTEYMSTKNKTVKTVPEVILLFQSVKEREEK